MLMQSGRGPACIFRMVVPLAITASARRNAPCGSWKSGAVRRIETGGADAPGAEADRRFQWWTKFTSSHTWMTSN